MSSFSDLSDTVFFVRFCNLFRYSAKLLKGIAKRQKQEEVWDNLGRTTNLNPMATALQNPYANLSLLFARYHAKIIPWGHKTADFVALGFQDSDEEEDEDDHEWE